MTQPNLPEPTLNTSSPPVNDSPASPASTASDSTQTLDMSSRTPSEQPIKIIVVSDMICPWCYIGFKSINRAISDLSINLLPNAAPKFDIEYRPFPLMTNLGSDDVAVDKLAHFEKRFGKEKVAEMGNMMLKRGRESGIEFKQGGLMRHTTRAHRLLWLAYQKGGMAMQQSLLAHLFRAYFEEEKDIGSPQLLAQYADLVGLMGKAEAEEWIKSKAGEAEVAKLVAINQGCNIRGVPFVVVNGKWAIGGGQPEGEYYKIFEKLAKGDSMQ